MAELHKGIVGILLMAGLAGCATVRHPDDAWWGRDKAWHFAAGAVLGGGTVAVGRALDGNDAACAAAAVGVVAAAGCAKETYDVRVQKSTWSWKDMVWNFVGCSVGASLALGME